MKTFLVLFVCGFFFQFCNSIAEQGSTPGIKSKGPTDTINFKTQVEPLLLASCSPCHFPGGKLYDKLPFDKAVTIINHREGILKRFKKEEDINLIKKFIAQNKPQN